jgi:large conductance mechanosensitive channel
MKLFAEFKTFAMHGSVVDLAVGVVVGAAFTGIVNSLVTDIITPPLGLAMGGLDFANYFLVLSGGGPYATLADAQHAGAVTLNYGLFFNALLRFLVVAFALFLVIRQLNRLTGASRAANAPPPPPPEDVVVLREIRDLLRERR